MQLLKHANSFMRGMNKDLSTSSFKEDTYFDAQNIRVVSGDDTFQTATTTPPTNDTGCISNVRGTIDSFRLSNDGRVVGYTTLGDNLIIIGSWKGAIDSITNAGFFGGLTEYTVVAPDHNLLVNDVICFYGTSNFDNKIFTITDVSTDGNEFSFWWDANSPDGYFTETTLTEAYWYKPKGKRVISVVFTGVMGPLFIYLVTCPAHGFTTDDYVYFSGTGEPDFDGGDPDDWFGVGVIGSDADHFSIISLTNPADVTALTDAYAHTLDTEFDKIYRIPFSVLDTNHGEIFELQDNYYFTSPEPDVYGAAPLKYNALVYQEDLGLNPRYPLDVISNFETTNVQKIYWCDGYNPLRHLNIVYSYSDNNLTTLDADLTNMVPATTHSSIDVSLQAGGNLKAGKIQYSYQLYLKHGAETMFSPCSNLINLTPYSTTPPNNEEFSGGDLSDVVNKSTIVTIDIGADYAKFNRMRLVALEYEAYATNPTVRIVSEIDISSEEVTLYDYGTSIGSMTLEDFRLIQNEISPISLIAKNNYLIAANIKQKYFDATSVYEDAVLADTTGDVLFPRLDMRAYRWKRVVTGEWTADKQEISDAVLPIIGAFSYIPTTGGWQLTVGPLSAETHSLAAGRNFTSIDTQSVLDGCGSRIELNLGADKIILLLKDYDTGENVAEVFYEEFGAGGDDYLTIRGNQFGKDSSTSGGICGPTTTYWNSDPAFATTITTQLSYFYNYMILVPAGPDDIVCELNYAIAGVDSIIVDTNSFEDVPVDNDCMNIYNDIAYDWTTGCDFKYQSDGATIGGEGPLIEYEFYETSIAMGSTNLKEPGSHRVLVSSAPYTNYINYEMCRDYVGYMRDEVYRFGIVFYDLQLRPSFVNWIGDIRFPTYYEAPPFDTTGYGSHIGIKFTVNWTDFPVKFKEQVSGFRIVRAPRRSEDRTIKFQGLIGMTLKDSNFTPAQHWSNYYFTSGTEYSAATLGSPVPLQKSNCGVADANWSFNCNLLEMFAPELSFNKEFAYEFQDALIVVGMTNTTVSYNTTTYESSLGIQPFYRDVTFACNAVDPISTKFGTGGQINPDSTLLSLPEIKDPASHLVSGEVYYARGSSAHTADGDETLSYKGTSLLFYLNPMTEAEILTSGGVMVANYRAQGGLSMYGGATYEQRSTTVYIPCGEFRSVDDSPGDPMYVYGGDTYLSYFSFLKLFADEDEIDGNGTWQTYVTFPVETSINVDWRNDQLQKNITFDNDGTGDRADYHLNEYETWGIEDYPATYPDTLGNLYVYNSAYSCWDESNIYLPEPFDFSNEDYYGNRVTSSDHKIANEYSDSWLKFRYVNYKDTESRYGNIVKLVQLNNNIIFFQPKAIGGLSIEERELIQGQNAGALSLGTGGVLSRYDYLTTTSGCSWPKAIATTEGNLYYFDYYNKSLRRLVQEGTEPVSELKGLKTYFNSKITTGTNVVLGYDRENRELLCGLEDALYGDNTVVYSLFTDNFLGFQTFNPMQFISVGNMVFSSPDDNTFWKHNFGERGHFYGTYGDSYVTICANPLKINAATYHIIEWLTDKYSKTPPIDLVPDETLTYIDLWNSYQDGKRLCKATSGTITAFADYSGTVAGTVKVTTTAVHNLETGVYVTIAGTTNYNGDFKVTVVDVDEFYITDTWVADDATGTFEHEGYIQRFRKWRANLLREDSDDSRLRDNHLFIKLVYENASDDNKIILHPLITSYLPTKI